MAKLTKHNFKKFTRKNLLPNTNGSKPYSQQANDLFRQNMELLNRVQIYYNSLAEMREHCERWHRYYTGDQFSDLVPDPDGCNKITEYKLISDRGQTPLSMNVIGKAAQAVVGVYTQSKLEPLCIARDRDEQKLGEMMTIAMEYAYQNLNLNELNTRAFERFLEFGIALFRVGYDINDKRKISDVKVTELDHNRIAFDNNTSGMYFENLSCIAYLHDMSVDDVLAQFAHSHNETERILQIYRECHLQTVTQDQQFVRKDRQRYIDFFNTLNPEDCRVYEIWTKERSESLYCHDTAKGEEYFVPVQDEQNVVAENQRRQMEMLQAGGDPNDAALIDYEYRIEKKWVVRYLTPNGYILKQEETPYWHGSHPFVGGAYPLTNGEIHSFVEKTINVQRMINRLLTRIEFERMNDSKGLTAVKKSVLEKSNVSEQEIAKIYTSPSAIVALEWEGNESIFQKPPSNSGTNSDYQMLSQYLTLIDEITGAHGAMRGETPKSGTPSSLYAQQTENANNNIADLINWYNGLICERDYKIMTVIQQYYQDKRFLNIAGKDYSEESKWYDPDKVRNSKFDLSLVENQATGTLRLQNENVLQQLFQNGMIDAITYLECSSAPNADKILERIKSRQEEQAQQQAELQQQQAIMQQQG